MGLLSSIRTFLAFVFHRSRAEREIEHELRSHLQSRADDLQRQGLSWVEAERQARVEFGGYERYKDECREALGSRLLGELIADVRYGLRGLRRNPGFTAVVVITLVLGMGATTAVFSVVDAILIRSLPYKSPGRLVMVWETYREFPKVWASVPNFLDWQSENHVFDAVGAYRVARGFTLTGQGEAKRVQGTFISASLFPLLDTKAHLGRTFIPAEDKPGSQPVLILSHRLWQRVFGSDLGIVGRGVTLDDKNYIVVGVMPPDFRFPEWADLWMPLGQMGTEELTSRVYHPLEIVARLRAGVTLAQARAEMSTIAGRLSREFPKTNEGWGASLVPLREELVGGVQQALLMLFGSAGLVLLIACANVANLMLSRAAVRRKEMAVRAALGADRWRLVRQLTTEAIVLSTIGGTLALLLTFWVRDLLVSISPPSLGGMSEVGINGPVLAFAVAVSIFAGLAFGLAPAVRVSRIDLNESLKDGARASSGLPQRSRLRGSLVVAQVALALVLLAGAGLLIKSFGRVLGVDPGFDPDHVMTARIDLPESKFPSPELFYEQVRQSVRALPGVETVGLVNYLPLGRESTDKTRFNLEAHLPSAGETLPVAELRNVNADYFRAMRIPLVKGRCFKPWGEEKQPVVIINETMARQFFPHEDPIGKRVDLGPEAPRRFWFSIVGVVGDVKDFGLAEPPRFDIYVDGADSGMSLVVRTTSSPLGLAPSIQRIVQGVNHEVPVTQILSMEQIISHSLASRHFSMVLLSLFAGLALTVAGVGIYGVVSYSVEQRAHEVGIRMALGAKRSDVLKLVVGQGFKLTLVGVAIGIVGAPALTRFLSTLLYGVNPTDPVTFVSVGVILVLVALPACYIPTRRATKVDPMVALRHE